jgi:thiol-disulfide isomerase/thioredoxin
VTVLAANRPVADIIVLKFSADWCMLSNQLAPDFGELREEHDAENILFVDLDLTDPVRRQQSKMLVAALGIENVWDEHGKITGLMHYIDPDTRRVVRTFGPDDMYDEMHFALNFSVDMSQADM